MKDHILKLFVALALLTVGDVARTASITWTNTAGGDWGVAANWSPNQVPGSFDSAFITNNGSYTVTITGLTVGNVFLGAESGQQILNWNGSTLAGQETLTVATNGLLVFSGGQLFGVITNAGTIQLLNGGGDLTLIGTGYSGSDGELVNLASGLVDIQGDNSINISISQGIVVNAGVIRKSGGTGVTVINNAFYNSGTLDVQTGTVNVQGGGSGSGVYEADAGATLRFSNSYEVDGQLTGAGTNWISYNTFTMNGGINGSNVVLNGANLQANNAVINGTLNWVNGNINEGSVLTVATNGLLEMTSGGSYSFPGALTNSGTIQLLSGTLSLNGDYIETASAREIIGIGGTTPGTTYGQIQFSSGPTIAGSFNVTLLNGFQPSPGDSFSVLKYPSLAGGFTCLNGLDLGSGLELVPQYGNTSLTLIAVNYAVTAQPFLSLYPTPNNGLLLSWPLYFTNWQLQTTTNLATHVWTPMTVQGTNNLVLPTISPRAFFRLMSN